MLITWVSAGPSASHAQTTKPRRATVMEILDRPELFIDRRRAKVKDTAQQPQSLRTLQSRVQLAFDNGAGGRMINGSTLRLGDCLFIGKGSVLVSGPMCACSRSVRVCSKTTNYILEAMDDGDANIISLEGSLDVQVQDDDLLASKPSIAVNSGQRLRFYQAQGFTPPVDLTPEDYRGIFEGPLFKGFREQLPYQRALEEYLQAQVPGVTLPVLDRGPWDKEPPAPFPTTTRLVGIATMTLGGAGRVSGTSFSKDKRGRSVPSLIHLGDSVVVNYDVKLNFDTSFHGNDLLRTTLRAGNFADSVFGNGNTTMEVAFEGASGADSVEVNRLFYQFPIGENWVTTVGASVRQDDMLAMWPSAYPADTILDLFTYAGARAAYSLNLGAGVGLWYKAAESGFNASVNFVSAGDAARNSSIGVEDHFTVTAQAGYAGDNWGAAFAYTYTDFTAFTGRADGSNSVGLSAYWSPITGGLVPSVSAGFGYSDFDGGFIDDAWSWMVGLQWADIFGAGNALGMALGSAGQAGNNLNRVPAGGLWTNPGQNTLACELWYKWQVTDNISVTPAFFWIENSGRQDTYGGVLKTTFRF
jgi:hypothetical protein